MSIVDFDTVDSIPNDRCWRQSSSWTDIRHHEVMSCSVLVVLQVSGKKWEYADVLFSSQEDWTTSSSNKIVVLGEDGILLTCMIIWDSYMLIYWRCQKGNNLRKWPQALKMERWHHRFLSSQAENVFPSLNSNQYQEIGSYSSHNFRPISTNEINLNWNHQSNKLTKQTN